MSIKQLEYFVAVSETLSFTKAAKKCFISQTAISLQIQSLETKLGVSLFIRNKHHVQLTAAGKVYLNEVKQILTQVDEAAKLAKKAAAGFSGTLTIGFIKGYEQSRFSETLRRFHESYPNISLHLVRENMSTLYDRLIDGECDIIFNLSPYFQNYPDLEQKFLKKVPLMAILYPGHPLAHKENLLYKELSKEDFIIMQPAGRPVDEAEEVMLCYKRGGFVPKIVTRDPEVETVLLMASSGLGVAILPEYAVRYFKNTRNLIVIPLQKEDGTAETLDFSVSYHTSHTNPSIDKLIQWMNDLKFLE